MAYHFNEKRGWKDDSQSQLLLNATAQALYDAIPNYGLFATVPNFYIFIVWEGWRDEGAEDANAWIAALGEPCRIELIYHQTRSLTAEVQKHIVAHGIWHFVQANHFGANAMEVAKPSYPYS